VSGPLAFTGFRSARAESKKFADINAEQVPKKTGADQTMNPQTPSAFCNGYKNCRSFTPNHKLHPADTHDVRASASLSY
jgi:hypothetical protein